MGGFVLHADVRAGRAGEGRHGAGRAGLWGAGRQAADAPGSPRRGEDGRRGRLAARGGEAGGWCRAVGSRGCAPAASPSDRGRATLRPCAPQYALRDSASVANSSAVWAQPPHDASAPAFNPVPPGSRSAHFLCVAGRLEVCLEGTTGARRQPDGAEQLALGPRVGSGAAGGLRTPAPRVRSTLLPRPSCSPLHGVCAASEVHGVCLCTTDSEQGFVYAYVGLARM